MNDSNERKSVTYPVNNHKTDDTEDIKLLLNDTHNISWSSIIEKNILEIGEKAKGYKIMHIKTSRQISYKYDLLMYSGIFLGPLSGLLSGIGTMLNPEQETTFPIIAACVAFISGILVAATKYGKFEEKSSHHKLAASKYTSLESNVRRQLALCRNDRINAGKYLEWIGNSFDDLFLASPLIATNIYESYVKMARENGMTVPDEYGITINVDETYQKKKIHEMKDSSVININDSSENYIKNIDLYEQDNEQNSYMKPSSYDISKGETETFKGTKEIKRNQSMSHFPELNKFSDGRMEYEIQRMMGLK